MGRAVAGQPSGSLIQAEDLAYEMPSTSHIAIVDGEGNAISMTTSIEMAFGSAVMVEGFLLNNQLTDFSLRPNSNGVLIANRIEPLKRPRSSMAPTMVFNQDNSLKLVVGSPGGSRIINYVTQTIIGVLDWQLDPQTAINLPKVTNRNKVTTLEKQTDIVDLKPLLESMGHKVSIRNLNSGLHVIEVIDNGLLGGADPRREGLVLAQ
jgi:gamma-glutamyltranspeptidase/glutathione hydrolase